MAIKNRETYNAYMRVKILERYHKRRTEAKQRLGGKCVVCGTKENLEFDHINAKEKSFGISKLWSVSQEKFDAELLKCQLLCKDHHEVKTKLFGDNTGGGSNRVDDYTHGTGYMYDKDKCRCDECKLWRKNYRNKTVEYSGKQKLS
jgi:5-methylcytosine-specific restriction endonuclease McrA